MLTLMDAEALAIIFMADGGTNLSHGKYPVVCLHTKGFSYGDNWLLKKAIKEKLGLEFNIHKHGKYFYLWLRTKDVPLFISLVTPWMCSSFLYKLERLAPEKGGDIVCSA